MAYIAAIDQGTTSSRCMIFTEAGEIAAIAQKEHAQIYPRPGWVEHDPEEIWRNVEACVRDALAKLSLALRDLAAIGITNQRETSVLWRRSDGKPIHNALVWQDTRTDALVRELSDGEGQDCFRDICGLPLATYFSGPKIRWMLDNIEGARDLARRGDLMFGTIDAWLIWKLTGAHVTDVTNASRTMLMNLATRDWDDTVLAAMDIPRAILPEIRSSSEKYGGFQGAHVAGVLGDQQSALVGQACFAVGDAKCTYGTGNFLLLNTGEKIVQSRNGLLTTLAYQFGASAPVYALEGSVAVTGALVQWLRDNMGMIAKAADIETLAASVADNGGCYFVPAFSGLFAPYWRSDARGVIAGLTGYVTRAHIARAVLEAAAWQTREIVDAMAADSGVALSSLRVDGGMTANNLLLQIQADALGGEIVRPAVIETTCLGAAYAAGLAVGLWPDLESLRTHWRADARFTPLNDPSSRAHAYAQWRKAVQRTLDWVS
jgi:glycerol kinase